MLCAFGKAWEILLFHFPGPSSTNRVIYLRAPHPLKVRAEILHDFLGALRITPGRLSPYYL